MTDVPLIYSVCSTLCFLHETDSLDYYTSTVWMDAGGLVESTFKDTARCVGMGGREVRFSCFRVLVFSAVLVLLSVLVWYC